jgi:hypothetical protein
MVYGGKAPEALEELQHQMEKPECDSIGGIAGFSPIDYTHGNCGATVEPTTARHHRGSNLAQYHYLEQRYGKTAKAQAFWATTGLLVLIIGSLVVIQMSETDVQRKARVEAEEAFCVRVACKLGERACAVAKEDSRRVVCRLFPEDCSPDK